MTNLKVVTSLQDGKFGFWFDITVKLELTFMRETLNALFVLYAKLCCNSCGGSFVGIENFSNLPSDLRSLMNEKHDLK
jgi:hypothetical protein